MKQSKKIVIFQSAHELSVYLLKHWMKMAQKAIQERGRFCVAMQGGESLNDFNSKLSGIQDYNYWENIHIFQTDQYHFPSNNLKNQYQFLKNTLIDYINIPAKNVFSIVTHTDNPAHSSDQYEEELTKFFELSLDEVPKFDCVLMGLNNTDHLRSLFEDSAAKPAAMPVMCQYHHNNLNLISINPQILADAEHLIFVGSGEKASLNACEMIEVWGRDFPAIKSDPGLNKSMVFLLDSVAANKLSMDYEYFDSAEGIVLFDKK